MGLFSRLRRKSNQLDVVGGVLTGAEIKRQMEIGNIQIQYFNDGDLNANSYNLRIGDKLAVYESTRVIDLHNPDTYKNVNTFDIPKTGVTLRPGNLYLIPTKEAFGSSKFEPIITGRSSIGRLGIEVHKEAGFGDIGFYGTWTLHVSVTYPTIVYPGDPILQVYFLTAFGPIAELYHGKYQNAEGVVPSKWGQSEQDHGQ